MSKEVPAEVLPPERSIPHGGDLQAPPHPRFSRKRLALAFATAALADGLSFSLAPTPPVQWAVDLATAILLFRVPRASMGARSP